MKKNCYIGYAISLVSGLIIIASAFLSLTMKSETGNLVQGESLFNLILSGQISTAVVFYMIGIILGFAMIVLAVIGLIFTAKDKYFKILLLIERIMSLVAFVCIMISFIIIGMDLLAIESTAYNFTGFGIVLAILGVLLLIEGVFLVRKPLPDGSKRDED